MAIYRGVVKSWERMSDCKFKKVIRLGGKGRWI